MGADACRTRACAICVRVEARFSRLLAARRATFQHARAVFRERFSQRFAIRLIVST
jgi:hypothetical protein